MQIKYIFLKTDGDDDIKDITIEQERVPRIGEYVDFEVRINSDEFLDRGARVDDVHWCIRNNKQIAKVFIA